MEGPQSTRASSGSTGSRGHSENIKKVAVTMTGQQALFMELDQTRPLTTIIQDIADQWKLSSIEDYALQFSEPTRQQYITELNREDIQNGNVLQLTDSPTKATQAIIDKLQQGARDEKYEALKSLHIKANDETFAKEFIKKDGLKLIVSFVAAGQKQYSGDTLIYLLRSFVSLMDNHPQQNDCWNTVDKDFTKHIMAKLLENNKVPCQTVCIRRLIWNHVGLKSLKGRFSRSWLMFYSSGDTLIYLLRSFVSLMDNHPQQNDCWNTVDKDFTKHVAECVSGARATSDGCISPALEILENVVTHSTKETELEHFITVDKIFPYMSSSSNDVKQGALALINAIFIRSSPEKQKLLADFFQSKNFRTVLQTGILGTANIGPEMAHQLYKLQRLMLNMYEDRMSTKFNTNDAAQVTHVTKVIEDLRRIAFDFSDMADQNASRKSAVSKDYKKLGFTNQTAPMSDFEVTPPGLLALDNMIYFAQVHKEQYIKVVLENSGRANEQDCPFVQASIRLTKILCDILKIGEAPNEVDYLYYPMIFSVDKPVEEFFSSCIQLLNRTWKEMRASREDFEKVLSVVREQIARSLDRNPTEKDKHLIPDTFEKFKTKLAQFAYPELKKIWEAERQKKDEHKASAKPILELREMIKPEIMDLIRKHRLLYLEGGSRFPKFDSKSSRVKNKYQYWRLAPNHKALHFNDCLENEAPPIELLPNKVNILDIRELLVGKNCPHVKNAGKKMASEFAFSIKLESSRPDEETFHNFQAHSEEEYHIWLDGIDALLNNEMMSKKTKEDMDVLLNMEIKLRLLETEGIPIPKDPPPIPPLPDNFNFVYTTA